MKQTYRKNPGIQNREKRKEFLEAHRGQGRIPVTRVQKTEKRKAYERSSREKVRVSDYN